LECLKYAHENGCPWDEVTCTNAVINDSLACLRYAHENGCPWGPEAYMNARASSACYRYLRDNDCPEGEASCIAAAKAGDLARLKVLHESGCTINRLVWEAAVEGNHLHVVKYLIGHDLPMSALICDTAVRVSSLSCLKYLKEQGCECTDWTLRLAASSRQSIDCFTYLVDEGCGVTIACEAARIYCNAEALLYALQKGCTGVGLSANYAAACGSLACLQYVHEQGGAWDETTCAMVVKPGPSSGHTTVPSWKRLQCLKYARENGCPWDTTTCQAAAGARDLNTLRYAHEHGCPWDEGTCRLAAQSGDLACLQYAHEHGCPWNVKAVKIASSMGSLSCLQYLHDHGCEWPEPAWFAGVDKDVRNRKCLEYAAEHPDQRPVVCITPPVNCSGWGCAQSTPQAQGNEGSSVQKGLELADPAVATATEEEWSSGWLVVGRRGRAVRNVLQPPPASDDNPACTTVVCRTPALQGSAECASCVGGAALAGGDTASAPASLAMHAAAEDTGAGAGQPQAVATQPCAQAGEETERGWSLVTSRRQRLVGTTQHTAIGYEALMSTSVRTGGGGG
jgi:hypothetical protein